MSKYKLVPVEPTSEMLAAGEYALEAGCYASGIYADMLASSPAVQGLVDALEQIERWDGFPSTDKTWEGSGEPVSYGAAFGSNGERDFMREVARKALAAHRNQGG